MFDKPTLQASYIKIAVYKKRLTARAVVVNTKKQGSDCSLIFFGAAGRTRTDTEDESTGF